MDNSINKKYDLILTFRFLFYAALAALLMSWSWLAWSDIVVDSGRELYVPWQLTEGKVLYKDIAYFNGPLSPYWNAFWFLIFGVSVRTLTIVNAALLILLIFLMEAWLQAISSRWAAMVAIIFFITVFAFGKYTMAGSFNYLAPYSHEMTHGLIIIFAMLICLRRWFAKRKIHQLAIAGLLMGLALLTKPEIMLAAFSASATYLIAAFIGKPKSSNRIIFQQFAVFLGTALFVVLIAVLLLSFAMSAETAFSGIFSVLPMIKNGSFEQLSNLPYYQLVFRGAGSIKDQVVAFLVEIVGYFLLSMAGVRLVSWFGDAKRFFTTSVVIISIIIFVGYRLIPKYFWMNHALNLLPIAMALGFFLVMRQLSMRSAENKSQETDVARLASFVFAGVLLLKIALNVRIYHYGFVLAMPATMLVIISAIAWLPKIYQDNRAWSVRVLALSFFITMSLVYLDISKKTYSLNTTPIGNGADKMFVSNARGPQMALALDQLEQRLRDDQTVLVLPEGIMVNYLLRRETPTQYINFMPVEFVIYGEDRMLDAFISNPPDFVLMVQRNEFSDYGMSFGKNYGAKLLNWARGNYHTVWRVGDLPFEKGAKNGIVIAERANSF